MVFKKCNCPGGWRQAQGDIGRESGGGIKGNIIDANPRMTTKKPDPSGDEEK